MLLKPVTIKDWSWDDTVFWGKWGWDSLKHGEVKCKTMVLCQFETVGFVWVWVCSCGWVRDSSESQKS